MTDTIAELRELHLAMADQAIAADPDHLDAPRPNDMAWLIAQLACWPTRVDPSCTTNVRFLMVSAAHALRSLLDRVEAGDPVAVVGKDWRLLWASQDTLTAIVERTGLQVGDKLYRHPPQPAWQNIETAPRDGSDFIGMGSNFGDISGQQGTHRAIVHYDEGYADFLDSGEACSRMTYLTHWMPLPEAPAPQQKADTP